MSAALELIVPGLLGPLPYPPEPLPATPALDLLLARGDAAPGLGEPVSGLLARFGAAASAPYCLAADDPAALAAHRDGHWLHADPVHLRADRDRLRLFDARYLGIDQAEADAMVAELNAHFAADGLSFLAPTPARWYLRAETAPGIETTPLGAVIGAAVDGALPTGPDARRWAALMNEAQMLLFQSPVNAAREQARRPAVNGIWTWGGGTWRPLQPAQPPARVLAADPLARGLALAAGIPAGPLPADAAEIVPGTLVLFDGLGQALRDQDLAAWSAAAQRLDQWLAPALARLRGGGLDAIRLDIGDGRARVVRRGMLRRFWRRPRPLGVLAAAAGSRRS